jgi:hypothetical protein
MPDLGSSTFTQADSGNATGVMPSWNGSAAPSTLDDAGRALQGAVTREWNWRNYTLTAGGSADAKTITYSVAPQAYFNGQRFTFIANTTNTGSATLNVNGLNAKTIRKDVSGTLTNLTAGDMASGMFVEVAYNTANDCFVWVNLGQVAGKANLSGGNTFSGDQVLSASATSGNTPRFILTNTGGGTPNAFGPSYVLQNGVAGAHGFIVTEMQSSGSEFVIANSESPFTQYFRITQNGQIQLLGALGLNGPNYGTPGQVPISNGSGNPPTWGSHINLGTAVNTTSGTAIDFTGLPAGIKRLTLSFSQLSTSGTSPVVLRIGSGSFLATGYLGGGGGIENATGQYAFTSTDGFALGSPGAANVRDGTIHIVRISSTLWSASGVIYSNNQQMIFVAGSISFSGDITGVRLTTSGGANTFDNGTANILWEF